MTSEDLPIWKLDMSADTSSINFDVGLYCNIFAAVLVKYSWNVATEHFFLLIKIVGKQG
jgi:hypothetical protein